VLSGRLFTSGLEALELLNVELGLRVGLYAALAASGPSTAGELATSAGIAERYAREWLEQHAVTGIIDVDDVTAGALERRGALPAAHAHVLLDAGPGQRSKPPYGTIHRFGRRRRRPSTVDVDTLCCADARSRATYGTPTLVP
jgi:hypothetical protein